MGPGEDYFKLEVVQPGLSTSNCGVYKPSIRGGKTHVIHYCLCTRTSHSPALQYVRLPGRFLMTHWSLVHRLAYYGNESWKAMVTAIPPHLEVSLIDSNDWKSSQWAELWAVYRVIQFVSQAKWPKVRVSMDTWTLVRTWMVWQRFKRKKIGISETRSFREEGLLFSRKHKMIIIYRDYSVAHSPPVQSFFLASFSNMLKPRTQPNKSLAQSLLPVEQTLPKTLKS